MKRSMFCILLVGLLLMTSVISLSAQDTSTDNEEQLQANKTLVTRFYDEIIEGRDLNNAEEILAEDYVHNQGVPDGREGFLQFGSIIRETFSTYDYTIHQMLAEGDWVGVRSTLYGVTQGGGMMAALPEGEFTIDSMDFFRISDGQLVEHFGIFDMLGQLQQLGVISTPESVEAAAESTETVPDPDMTATVNTTEDHNPVANKAVVLTWIDSRNINNLAAIDQLVSETFIQHAAGGENGHEGLRAYVTYLLSAFPDFSTEVQISVAEGDWVALYSLASGTHTGDYNGIPATGLEVSVATADFYRVEEGLIAEHWNVTDMFELLQQLEVVSSEN